MTHKNAMLSKELIPIFEKYDKDFKNLRFESTDNPEMSEIKESCLVKVTTNDSHKTVIVMTDIDYPDYVLIRSFGLDSDWHAIKDGDFIKEVRHRLYS